jgi:hypothetical protein
MCRSCEIREELGTWQQALTRSYELMADGKTRRQAWARMQEEELAIRLAAERKLGQPVPLATVGRAVAIRLKALTQAYAASSTSAPGPSR